MLEICLWNPDLGGKLRRSDRIPDTIPGISRFQHVVLHQGRIERFFLDSLKEHSNIRVERGVLPERFTFDETKAEDPNAYPIEVILQHLEDNQSNAEQDQAMADGAAASDCLFRSNMAADDTEELSSKAHKNGLAGISEKIKAKYMIGCDGAHSWTRRQLGYKLEGEQTDFIWGVLDIVPITGFPDIRMRFAIHSANSGSMMVISRENKLVTSTATGGLLIKLVNELVQNSQKNERIFLAGDAVHTHSPKAGQGMNVSMQDTYNLGWKIAAVLNGTANRSILKTYQSERRRIAQDLIAFDHKFSRLFSGRPAKDVMDEEGISMDEFKDAFEKGNFFTSGIAVNYGSSIIVAKDGDAAEQGDGTGIGQNTHVRVISKEHLAFNIKIGMRMPSFKVLNQSDARPWHFQERLKSDGR
ncbi:hypothetical protein DID88_000318 [Monilinia fructigena]|uniref:FAD-binding domain-containing protein n=1 Tax=Monilinia fructigena TaxID=38457 RepID=A0A395IH72_9HELO|nr:hypothetical protein DID88_000318 [Monilinia fructigena]